VTVPPEPAEQHSLDCAIWTAPDPLGACTCGADVEERDRATALAVTCPACGARTGQPCRSVTGAAAQPARSPAPPAGGRGVRPFDRLT